MLACPALADTDRSSPAGGTRRRRGCASAAHAPADPGPTSPKRLPPNAANRSLQPGSATGFVSAAMRQGFATAPHGLRKAAATIAAENGATAYELMSIFGWLTLKEAERYTRAAERKRLGVSSGTGRRPASPSHAGSYCWCATTGTCCSRLADYEWIESIRTSMRLSQPAWHPVRPAGTTRYVRGAG